MSDTINEKYISIEYEKWESYYKPLEQINEQLQRELRNQDIVVRIDGWRHSYSFPSYGTLSVHVSGGYTIKNFSKDDLIKAIERAAGIKLIKSEEEIKMEDKILEAKEKIDNLPRIVKFLFNIKY